MRRTISLKIRWILFASIMSVAGGFCLAQGNQGQYEDLMKDRVENVTGQVVVISRSGEGQARRLGIESTLPDGKKQRYWIWDDNKGRELIFRVGQNVEVQGITNAGLNRTRSIRVRKYRILGGNQQVANDEGEAGFRLSFLAGGLDPGGSFLGGTEIRALAAFDGKVFAGNGYWNELAEGTQDPYHGAQVLVLDRSDGLWRLDREFTMADGKTPELLGLSFLEPVTFVTDHRGEKLKSEVRVLTTGGFGRQTLYLRESGKSDWIDTAPDKDALKIGETPFGVETRCATGHTDKATGISHIFIGVTSGGIRKGGYDPALPGKIRWDEKAEYTGEGRAMGLADCNGVLYASFGDKLLRRIDGKEPRWEVVYTDDPGNRTGGSAVRRAAFVSSPDGSETSIIFGVEGSKARTIRLDPNDRNKQTVELSMPEYFNPIRHGIIDYNGVTRTIDPSNGLEVGLMGLLMLGPAGFGGFYDWHEDGLLFWRTRDGQYHLNRIHDPTLAEMPPLVGVRQIVASPFENERNVFYFSGYDTVGHPVHNTGWIFKGHINSILKEYSREKIR